MRRTTTAIGSLFIVCVCLRADAAIQLRLAVEPQSQLPAIPPSLRVEAINTGSEPAELPPAVVLQVMPADGRKPFVAYTGLRGDDHVTWFSTGRENAPAIVLAPKETRDVSFWAGPESPVWFAADSRLLSPGTYRLQLVAHDKLDSALLDDLERAIDQRGLIEPIVSNEATYIVETPRGEDHAVWQMIRQLQSPARWSDALGQRIWAEHPDSRYVAYCLNEPKATEPELSIAAYKAALEKQPSRPWADRYQFGIARDELSRSHGFIAAREVDGAYAARQRAQTILARLAKEAVDPDLRSEAQQILDTHAWTREQLAHQIARLNGEIRETQPHAVCVEKLANGKHIFWFGYDNTTREPMTIPIGPNNKFTPPPFDRGQPRVFPPHETVLGVRVETNEPAVMWHLQNHDVLASLAKTPPCPPDLHDRYSYEPPPPE